MARLLRTGLHVGATAVVLAWPPHQDMHAHTPTLVGWCVKVKVRNGAAKKSPPKPHCRHRRVLRQAMCRTDRVCSAYCSGTAVRSMSRFRWVRCISGGAAGTPRKMAASQSACTSCISMARALRMPCTICVGVPSTSSPFLPTQYPPSHTQPSTTQPRTPCPRTTYHPHPPRLHIL